MEKRSYKKYVDVYRDLEKFCAQSLESGCALLPGERELASLFSTSRLTLRKALEDAQKNGLIRREGKHTEVLLRREFTGCGRILFIAPGMHDSFFQPAFERLWLTLKPQLERGGGVADVCLDNPERDSAEFFRELERADVILVTLISREQKEKYEYLLELQRRKTVIALSDPYLEDFENVIALDNRAVGELAAKALLAAGCRRCQVVDVAMEMSMFTKRQEGFRDYFMKHGGKEAQVLPRHLTGDRTGVLLEAYENGFDGAFVATDEYMVSWSSELFQRGLVPERFKLISFNGSGVGMRCSPSVTCVNHGTAEVVTEITGYLKRLARLGSGEKVRKLIRPHLYLNKTIGDIKKQGLKS